MLSECPFHVPCGVRALLIDRGVEWIGVLDRDLGELCDAASRILLWGSEA